jgi:hypothetical protein
MALARVGELGVVGWIQLSNKVDSRLGDIVARQSDDPPEFCDESCFTVLAFDPSSSSCRASKRVLACITFSVDRAR